MIYLRCKYDIISVPLYAEGIYHRTTVRYHIEDISPVPSGTDIIEKRQVSVETCRFSWSEWRDSNSRHRSPKENRSTCFRSFPGISAPFRSQTHPFRHSYLHCFRVLRSCLWDKLWSSKTPRMQLRAASEVFLFLNNFKFFGWI